LKEFEQIAYDEAQHANAGWWVEEEEDLSRTAVTRYAWNTT